jgi:hypothetical protein
MIDGRRAGAKAEASQNRASRGPGQASPSSTALGLKLLRKRGKPPHSTLCSALLIFSFCEGVWARELFGFLHGFEVGFQGGTVLFLGFQFGLEFFDEQLEATDFVAELLGVG